MRKALLIGVSAPGLDVGFAAERVTTVLERAGFAVERCVDESATRDGILAALSELVRGCGPGHARVIHYFGHGGRLRVSPEHVAGYITCREPTRAIFDVELSDIATQLDRACGNVTVLLDCCYSGELVRAEEAAPEQHHALDPEWALELLRQRPTGQLALDSHPRIVRLGGASPKQQAFALVRGGRNIGALTEAWVDTLEAASDAWPRLAWGSAIHAVRERVFERLRFEGQWPALAGPRDRLLFADTHVELPGTVAWVPAAPGRDAFLRAGWLQGVAVGDRWAVCSPLLDADGRLPVLGEVEVESVDRNRAVVVGLDVHPDPRFAGLPAMPLRAMSIVELERTLASRQPDRCPIRWTWARADGTALAERGATIEDGARVTITLAHDRDAAPGSWFVSVVFVDGHGHARLLSTRMPEGIELLPGDHEVLGVRPGRPDRGLALAGPGPAWLLFLASRRPIELGHVLASQPAEMFEALRFQGLAPVARRAAGPEPSRACAWGRLDFTILPA